AARRQLHRADRLERAFGQLRFQVGEVERGGEAEQGEVAEEHAELESFGNVIPSAARNPLCNKAGRSLRSGWRRLVGSRLAACEPRMRVGQIAFAAPAQREEM